MIEDPSGTRVQRGSFNLICDRSFGPFFAAFVVSAVGVWIHNIVAAVVVFQLTGSALATGAVSMAQFLPQLLLAPAAGALADRGNRVHQLVVGRCIAALGGGGLALWVAITGVGGLPGPAPVIGAGFVAGIGFAIGAPALQSLVPALVRPSELSTAVALAQVPHTLARGVGPAIGALILATLGPAAGFLVAAASNALHGFVAARLTLRPMERRTTTDGSVRAGFHYLRVDSPSALLLAGIAAVGIGLDPLITLTPPLAAQLDGGSVLVGWLVSAFGAGATIVAMLLGRVQRRIGIERLSPFGFATFSAAYVSLTFVPSVALSLMAMFAAGTGSMLVMTSLTTQLQSRLPEEFRGRIMALWGVAYLGARPVGALVNGLVADLHSVDAAFLLMAALLTAGAFASRPSATHVAPR